MVDTAVVKKKNSSYPASPFDPPEVYPELRKIGLDQIDKENLVYGMVRQCLRLMGLDKEHAGSSDWNPLAKYINPSSKVVIKPNFVQHYDFSGSFHQLVTHPSVVRPILDYILLAKGSLNDVVVVDSPEANCILEKALHRLGWDILVNHYEALGYKLTTCDLRTEQTDYCGGRAIVKRIPLPGDPRGYVNIDLGTSSELSSIANDNLFYGADYKRQWTNINHTPTVNRYKISKTFLEADFIISVPKLKTHKKAGITCAMKNLVGSNGDKNLLPHYKIGDKLIGGCEYSTLARNKVHSFMRKADRLYRDWLLSSKLSVSGQIYNKARPFLDMFLKPWIEEHGQIKGDWWGNDVVWRMILDLNKILLYSTPQGSLARKPIREQLSIVDAILVGEGEGPHLATPKELGVVIGGFEAPIVDAVASMMLGFNPNCIPQLYNAGKIQSLPILNSNKYSIAIDFDGSINTFSLADFPISKNKARTPAGWIGWL
jgi:uncharacterized protein (DUF362 family)